MQKMFDIFCATLKDVVSCVMTSLYGNKKNYQNIFFGPKPKVLWPFSKINFHFVLTSMF